MGEKVEFEFVVVIVCGKQSPESVIPHRDIGSEGFLIPQLYCSCTGIMS